jgi:predicted nucleic acid-binding protein
MNVVDSSGWIEYFTDGAGAAFFAPVIEKVDSLIVPAIVVNEVLRKTLRDAGEAAAQTVLTAMRQGTLVPLDETLAVSAARLGLTHKLPLADAIVLATARASSATLWTQDKDFEGLARVRYQGKKVAARPASG